MSESKNYYYLYSNHPSIYLLEEGKKLHREIGEIPPLHQKEFSSLTKVVDNHQTGFIIGDFNTGKTDILRRLIDYGKDQGKLVLVLDEAYRLGQMFGYAFGTLSSGKFDSEYGLEEIVDFELGENADFREKRTLTDKIKKSGKKPLHWFFNQHKDGDILVIVDEIKVIFPSDFISGQGNDHEGWRRMDFIQSISQKPNVSMIISEQSTRFFEAKLLPTFDDAVVKKTKILSTDQVKDVAQTHLDLSQLTFSLTEDFISALTAISGGNLLVVNMAMATTIISTECSQIETDSLDKKTLEWLEESFGHEWFFGHHLEATPWRTIFDQGVEARAKLFTLKDINIIESASRENRRLEKSMLTKHAANYGEELGLLVATKSEKFRIDETSVINRTLLEQFRLKLRQESSSLFQKYTNPDVFLRDNISTYTLLAKLFTKGEIDIGDLNSREKEIVLSLQKDGLIIEGQENIFLINQSSLLSVSFENYEKEYSFVAAVIMENLTGKQIDFIWQIQLGKIPSIADADEIRNLENLSLVKRDVLGNYSLNKESWFTRKALNNLSDIRALNLYHRLEDLKVDEFLYQVNKKNQSFKEDEVDKKILSIISSWGVVVKKEALWHLNLDDPSVKEIFSFWLG